MAEDCYAVKNFLGISEILTLLHNAPPNTVTNPPQRPKANEVYVFQAANEDKQGIFNLHIYIGTLYYS